MSSPFEVEARIFRRFFVFAGLLLVFPAFSISQTPTEPDTNNQETQQQPQLTGRERAAETSANDYRIGSNDVVEINVFQAPELNRKLRVSSGGEISVPLLGEVQSGGLTAQQLATVSVWQAQVELLTQIHQLFSVFVTI